MKILWIPHMTYQGESWEGSRQFHFFKRLRDRHDLHIMSWTESKQPKDMMSWGRWSQEKVADGTCYTVLLGPKLYRAVKKGYPDDYLMFYNNVPFRRALRQIYQAVQPDIVVMNAGHHITGFPDFNLDVPIIYDHLDESEDWVEKKYTEAASAVVAVSEELANAVRKYGKPTTVIQNGVDFGRYTAITKADAKVKLGLTEGPVVSIIGLTCAPTLYFIDAVKQLQERVPNLHLVTVGGGRTHEAILAKVAALGMKNTHIIGAVPNTEVHWYFAATDVGLYPGEDNRYYRRALPLKIVEYTACKVPVVSSPVEAFSEWSNVQLVADNAEAFAVAIENALNHPTPAPDVSAYDWNTLTGQFEAIMQAAQTQSASV
jgi:glycosyltransferase involved in cell wall biosynthesis